MKLVKLIEHILNGIEQDANGSHPDYIAGLKTTISLLVIKTCVIGNFVNDDAEVDPKEVFKNDSYIQELINQSTNEKDQ